MGWRLQEFRSSYPNGALTAEVLSLDIERDLVVIKVTAKADGQDISAGVGLPYLIIGVILVLTKDSQLVF